MATPSGLDNSGDGNYRSSVNSELICCIVLLALLTSIVLEPNFSIYLWLLRKRKKSAIEPLFSQRIQQKCEGGTTG
jgi:hypothetical protein